MSMYKIVRGTKDLLEEDVVIFSHIENTAKNMAKIYGFKEVRTPIFEFTNLFTRNLGESSDVVNKEMYTFLDRNNESISLRPEGTAPIVRMLFTNSLLQKMPAKYFYLGPMFRYERPQKGRQRQFHQFGVEYFGAETEISDVEVISLAYKFLKKLIPKFTLIINSLGSSEVREIYKQELVNYLENYKQDLSEDSINRLKVNPLRILDSKDDNDKLILKNAPNITDFFSTEDTTYFNNIKSLLDAISIPYKVDTKLVRGLDYYTSTVFEFVSNEIGAQSALLAGGRYDNLVANMGGKPTKAVGWAAGIERLALFNYSTFNNNIKVAVIGYENSNLVNKYILETTNILRNNFLEQNQNNYKNISFEIIEEGSNISKKLKKANNLNFNYAIIVGEDEIKSNTITLKNLEQGTQNTINIKDFFEYL